MMGYWERNDSGYTRGGLDVVTGINLFFKGILIFPILMLAVYIGLAMMKHMLWNGIPHMDGAPTTEEVSVVPSNSLPNSTSVPTVPEPVILPAPYEYDSSTSVFESTNTVSNCKYSPVCPPGGENRVGANGLPYVWPTATSAYAHGVPAEHYQEETRTEPTQESWITSIEEDPFE